MHPHCDQSAPPPPPEDGLPTSVLAARCAEETRRYLAHVPYTDRYSHALFRRALVDRDERAWDALYTCYAPLVRRWAAQVADDGDAEALVSAAFERLWAAIGADRFARFPDARSLLQYLKLCVRSAALDRRRAAARTAFEAPLEACTADDEGRPARELVAADDVERETLEGLARREFWDAVRRQLQDDYEERLVRLSYIEGMPPRDICRREPEMFPTVHDVYRIKRNMLDRLQRNPVLRELAGYDGRTAAAAGAGARRGAR